MLKKHTDTRQLANNTDYRHLFETVYDCNGYQFSNCVSRSNQQRDDYTVCKVRVRAKVRVKVRVRVRAKVRVRVPRMSLDPLSVYALPSRSERCSDGVEDLAAEAASYGVWAKRE